MTDAVVAERLLIRAAEIIEQGGWRRHAHGNVQSAMGSHCVFGAVLVARHEMLEPYGQHSSLSLAAQMLHSVTGGDIVYWNDNVARDADDVLETLKLAVEKIHERC